MTFPIYANLKNRNGLNTHLKAGNRTVLSGGCPQGTSGVSARTEFDFGQTLTSLFPGGFLEVTWGRDKVTALLCKAPSNGLTESPWLSPGIREWAWIDVGWEAVYLRFHGQLAISSLCLSRSLHQSCWDCLLRVYWEQTSLSSPFSQKMSGFPSWWAVSCSSFPQPGKVIFTTGDVIEPILILFRTSEDSSTLSFSHTPPNNSQTVLSFLFTQLSKVIKHSGLIKRHQWLSPSPWVICKWSKPTM